MVPPYFATFMPHTHGTTDARLVVRAATASDVPAIVAIDETRGPRNDAHAAWVLERVLNPAALVLVAAVDDVVVGSTMTLRWVGHTDAPDGWYVSGVTVLPDQRRHGAGTRLLDALTTWIWDRDDTAWSVINALNLPSLALHAQRGFQEVGRGSTFAGITFTGGTGVLLRADRP